MKGVRRKAKSERGWIRDERGVVSFQLAVGRSKWSVGSSQQIQVIKSKLAGGLGSAVAVFQTDDVVFPQVIPELDFDELHQLLTLVGQVMFLFQGNVNRLVDL